MNESDRPIPDVPDIPMRRTCTGCGKEKNLSRFPARGRGKSTVCRGCLSDGKRPKPRPARRMTENDSKPEAEAPVAEPEVIIVSGLVRPQVMEFAKSLRQTAHELRAKTKVVIEVMTLALTGLPDTEKADGFKMGLEGYGVWVDEAAAKALDRAAAQLELLCR